MILKWISCSAALWVSLAAAHGATTLSSATSGTMVIDTRVNKEKVIVTFGRYWPTQAVRYSGYAWDTRFASGTAEVTADGVTLVKSADEGQVAWRPARVGLHTLHHTVHGGTLTRTYYAEGPTVRIVCTQTGTAGPMLCQIDCDMPDATIYYTTDGTEPTTASRVYTGPFQATLPKVKRLLAVAVVDGYPMSQTAYPIISVIEDVSVASSATSGKMVVDTRAGKGPIETDHAEDITYSNLWAGDADATATVAVNGEAVKTEAGEGVYRWPLPSKGGNYVLTHQTTKNGAQVGETLTATFVVASHEIEIDDGTDGAGGKGSRFSYSGVYDGQGHGISVDVTSVANPTIRYAHAKNGPYVESLLLTNACDATAIWYTVAASGYNTYTNWATVTITPRPVTLTSGTKTDFVYDGQPHEFPVLGKSENGFISGDGVTASNWATVTAVAEGEVENTFDYAAQEGTDLANYELTVVTGKIAVTKTKVGPGGGGEPGAGDVPDGGLSKFDVAVVYDGEGHTVKTNELQAAFDAAMVGECAVEYAADDGSAGIGGRGAPALPWGGAPVYTNAGTYVVWYKVTNPNYEDFVHAAKVTIAKRPVTVAVAGHTATYAYDTTEKSVSGYDAATEDALYDIAADTVFSGTAAASRTDAGTTAMGLTLGDFANSSANFHVTYEVADGWLRVTPATLDPGAVFGGGGTDAEGRLVCTRVYSGAPQPFAPAIDFGEPYRLLYALVAGDESAYSGTAPTRTHVAEGDLVVFFKFMSPNYAPYYGTGVLRIAPKALTDAMVIADEDSAWFFDGTEKRPAVTVVDGSPNAATADDWTVAYSGRTGAGLFPVTVTGRNDYCGTVTKEFAILKRPVAPPVIPSKAYSGRLQKPGVPSDARWTVVANPGGTDAGDYTNVVLRLTAPADYRWKGLGEDETDWTGVFTIRRGANGWSVRPGISGWTNGVDAASAPVGRPRFGTLSVAYRRRGAPVETESPLRPSAPGRYTARFWAEETANYAGIALATPYEVDFEIFPGPGDPPAGAATATTPVPVPYAWLDAYVVRFGAGDYETAANAVGANGVALWESYVAGLDPADASSRFTALISLDADGAARVTWTPDLSGSESPRTYTVYGKAGLGDADWTPVTDANRARMRFFRVRVELK